MNWFEITVLTSSEASDAVCEKMTLLGAHGAAVEDPKEIEAIINAPGSLSYADEGYLENLGDITAVRAYFADTEQSGHTMDQLIIKVRDAVCEIGSFLDIAPGEVSAKIICDEDWANSWKKYFKPLRISPRVMICPSWEECAVDGDTELVVKLDPGSAFGTGEHVTTAMCAAMLDQELGSRIIKPDVLDLGCGSGILAIIAAGLGASGVDAVDIDPVAVKTAEENCRVNGVGKDVNVFRGEIKDILNKKYDVIVANIIADVIRKIVEDIPGILANKGVFITGGIIAERKPEIIESATRSGLRLIGEKTKDGWVTLKFTTLR